MFIFVSILIQLAFAIHATRTGRHPIWVVAIAFIPIAGWLAYVIIELLPQAFGISKEPLLKETKLNKSYTPPTVSAKEIQEAQKNLALADTVSNRMRLADLYLKTNQFREAKVLYEKSLVGINKTDPMLMFGLARAELGLKNYHQAIDTLDALKAANPDYKSQDAHLVYARAQEGFGNIDAAIHEYEALMTYYPGPEPTCHLARLLKGKGDKHRAKELFSKIVNYSKTAGDYYNERHHEWIALAEKEMVSN